MVSEGVPDTVELVVSVEVGEADGEDVSVVDPVSVALADIEELSEGVGVQDEDEELVDDWLTVAEGVCDGELVSVEEPVSEAVLDAVGLPVSDEEVEPEAVGVSVSEGVSEEDSVIDGEAVEDSD